jgi:hypothetical protein
MRVGKIENMDKIANAGSITRVIVGAQNLKMGLAAQRVLDLQWVWREFPVSAIRRFFLPDMRRQH